MSMSQQDIEHVKNHISDQVTVFANKNDYCPPCERTIKRLSNMGIEHEVIAVDDPDNKVFHDYVTETLGYTQVPVVVTHDGSSWSGFVPDKIKALGENALQVA